MFQQALKKDKRDKDIRVNAVWSSTEQQQAEIYVWRIADKQDKHDRYWERLTIAWKEEDEDVFYLNNFTFPCGF